jgi:hypothetical protein
MGDVLSMYFVTVKSWWLVRPCRRLTLDGSPADRGMETPWLKDSSSI